jgi:membrane protease YdiL (CAAX protease family)
MGLWWFLRSSLPADVPAHDRLALLVLRTTLLVGLNEEWLFRGLLLAAFCRWWGLRRGSVAALLAFGAFHLLNMAAGVPWQNALVQFCVTFTLGAVFLMAALGTRSLLLPMVGHALYDAAVIGMGQMVAPAGMAWAPALLMGVAFPLAAWCFFVLARWPAGQPYGDSVLPRHPAT